MSGKIPLTVQDQLSLLQERNMQFRDIDAAPHFLSNISYYRLKGYWWEMQEDKVLHTFKKGSVFEDVIDLYNFDRHFRLLIFNAIERIEISLRTKLIYHLSLSHGAEWYLKQSLFRDKKEHIKFLSKLLNDMCQSSEEFMVKHYLNHPNDYPEAWKGLEVVTLGTLSKLFDNLEIQLPEKSKIANEFGLSSTRDFSSWLRTITLIRNLIAHHSRLWNRALIIKYTWPNNLSGTVLNYIPNEDRKKKIFPILCAMLYMNDKISPGHSLKKELIELIKDFPNIPPWKMGFPKEWLEQPLFSQLKPSK
ncbi:Abortive infection bacteriophage resistance protein [Sphingobacterium nematocida]|uniref:Abortive infection bacteriophage resistance protein n=1 Tax=Sphingobacterium nematocida TaxID=1513896 RepID=A0A1T5G2Z9_9SPHI|nr:Abi family protein [Sphingobacterium nematocida]SKC02801.1 Abortive infection bacteriophage resistance protein [Sphingobacterium nematocida]